MGHSVAKNKFYYVQALMILWLQGTWNKGLITFIDVYIYKYDKYVFISKYI